MLLAVQRCCTGVQAGANTRRSSYTNGSVALLCRPATPGENVAESGVNLIAPGYGSPQSMSECARASACTTTNNIEVIDRGMAERCAAWHDFHLS